MKTVATLPHCPSCSNPLRPKVFVCDDCEVSVEGRFELNEFATLDLEDLHFLRVFVRCEGRVRDMETALGLSYPTIRTRLTELKNKIENRMGAAQQKPPAEEENNVQTILKKLENKELSFEEALSKIKKIQTKKKG